MVSPLNGLDDENCFSVSIFKNCQGELNVLSIITTTPSIILNLTSIIFCLLSFIT